MRKAFTIGLLLLGSLVYSQTHFGVGAGALEQSRNLGVSTAVRANLDQALTENFGVSMIYTYGFLQTGDVTLLFVNDGKLDAISLPEDGSRFQQLQVMANYKFYTNDDKVAIRLNGGAARQISGSVYPTFGLDLMAFPKADLFPVLSWSPVIRDAFGEGKGWSHTVTINLIFKL